MIVWSYIIYIFWWKNTQAKNKFDYSILFCLSLPYIYGFLQIYKNFKNPFYPSTPSCLTFDTSDKDIMAKWNLECEVFLLKGTVGDSGHQSLEFFNITYTLLLLMIMATAFKYNILDNNMIRNFSIWILMSALWTTSVMYLGAYGLISGILVDFNTVIATSAVSSLLIILLNIIK